MNEQKTVLTVDDDENRRIDILVAAKTGLSRTAVQRLLNDGDILVNDRKSKANYKTVNGDCITVNIPPVSEPEIIAEDIPLDILYEDAAVLVVNKRRGMVVHPAAGNYSGTLVNALLKHCDDLSGIGGVMRPGIVHRLDKDTSGVMIVTKTDKAHHSLSLQIKERTAKRKYIALVHDNVRETQGMINAPIGRHKADRKKMAVTETGGKTALTHFKVLERFGQYTLVECRLDTGRTHQIRVHMAYIGHPVVNDPKYGPARKHFAIKGQALHSETLDFFHPDDNRAMHFAAPLPSDMQKIINHLRNKK